MVLCLQRELRLTSALPSLGDIAVFGGVFQPISDPRLGQFRRARLIVKADLAAVWMRRHVRPGKTPVVGGWVGDVRTPGWARSLASRAATTAAPLCQRNGPPPACQPASSASTLNNCHYPFHLECQNVFYQRVLSVMKGVEMRQLLTLERVFIALKYGLNNCAAQI